jgi:hypothetical protein
MEAPSKPKTIVIDSKVIEIKQLPPGPVDPNVKFDRWSHDNAGLAPEIERNEALARKEFGSPLSANGRRIGSKRQAE